MEREDEKKEQNWAELRDSAPTFTSGVFIREEGRELAFNMAFALD